LLRNQGELYVFRGEAARSDIADKIAVYQAHGIRATELNAAELRERIPALSDAYRHGYYLPDSAFTTDPRALTAALAAAFVANGGNFEQQEVLKIYRGEHGGVLATTSGASLSCDHLVIAAGAFSKRLAKQ